ncbi:MAG: hypothetical protein PHV34_22065 [Verrucomicrobiae bacterium]|nr:hypothetical protein [Verrucomicrobiae bacterium]
MKNIVLIFIAVACFGSNGARAEKTSWKIPAAAEKFQLDGKLTEDFYQKNAPRELVGASGGGALKQKTQVWVAMDRENLHFAFKCFEGQMDKLVQKIKRKDAQVYLDDCVEVFIDPDLSRKKYYHFILNTLETRYDSYCDGDNGDNTWDGEWRSAVFCGADHWAAEISIPSTQFLFKSVFGLNLCRERHAKPAENGSLADLEGGFHSPDKFPRFSGLPLANGEYVKAVNLRLFADSKSCFRAEIANAGKKAEEFKVSFAPAHAKACQKTESLRPGENKKIVLDYPTLDGSCDSYELSICVGEKLLYGKKEALPHLLAINLPGDSFFSGEKFSCHVKDDLLAGKGGFSLEIAVEGNGKNWLKTKARLEPRMDLILPALPKGDYSLEMTLLDEKGNFCDKLKKAVRIICLD